MNTLQPLPDYSDAALAAFTTDELLELLARDEDRVPRNVIDECARRDDAILPHLRRVLEQYLWDAEMPMGQWWRLLHAVMILGLIPTAAAGLLLVETMRRMSEEDDDNLQGWLTSDWPALFGNKPDTLIEALRTLSADRDSDWYIRAGARDAMVAMAHRMGAATLEAALEMLAASAQDETEDWDYRLLTANALLDFPRPQYRELLQALAKRQKGFGTVLSRDYIEEAYAAAQDQPRWTQHPWNPWDFYKPQVIAARQERWAEEDRKALERGNRLAEGEDYGDDDDDDDDDAYAFTEPYVRDTPKVGRNDPCPCGSGKKYKKCCLGDDMAG